MTGLIRQLAMILVCALCAGCSSAPPGINAGGAAALRKAAPSIRSATMVRLDPRGDIQALSAPALDSLKSLLGKAEVSESLLLTPAPWDVAFDLDAGKAGRFVGLYYGDAIRVKVREPWSQLIADSVGTFPVAGIADLVLTAEDAAWLFDWVGKAAGEPASKHHTVPPRRGIPLPE